MSDLGRAATARRLYLHVLSGGSLTPDDVSRMVQAIEELEAAIRWVDEVYPSRIEAGGAGIEITWAEFNAMQRALGVKVDARIGDQEGRAGHNHKLRVRAQAAEARAEAAEAKLATARNDALEEVMKLPPYDSYGDPSGVFDHQVFVKISAIRALKSTNQT